MAVVAPARPRGGTPPPAAPAAPPQRPSRALEIAIGVEGVALAVLVAVDGSVLGRILRAAAVLAVAVLVARVAQRGSRRAAGWAAFLFGLAGLVAGAGIGVPFATKVGLDVRAGGGLVALGAGLVTAAIGAWTLLRLARGWRKLWALPVAFVVAQFVLLPLPAALYATNLPRPELGEQTPLDAGLEYAPVTLRTHDGVDLAAWYVPSANGAAVVVAHGAGSTRTSVLDQAVVLARAGYGVLLVDARGHGASDGRAMDFGWYGDADLRAAVDHLASRPEVDDGRIGVLGLSMGGEEAIGAAAADPRIRAVVAEGATTRQFADQQRVTNPVERAFGWVLFTATDLLTEAEPPTPLRQAVADADGTPFLLIAGEEAPGEASAATWFQSAAPERVTVWVVPDAGHTDGLDTARAEWTSRVTSFLDAALAPRADTTG